MRSFVVAAAVLFATAAVAGSEKKSGVEKEVTFELTKDETIVLEKELSQYRRDTRVDPADLSESTYDALADGFLMVGVDVEDTADGGLDCSIVLWPPSAGCCIGNACCQVDPHNGGMCYIAECND